LIKKHEKKMEGEKVEEYKITSEGVETKIEILKQKKSLVYRLVLPEIDVATDALLDDVKTKIIEEVDVSPSDILDHETLEDLKKAFKKQAEDLIKRELPNITDDLKDHFTLDLIHDILGLEEIEYLLADQQLEEIVVNSSKEPVRIYHKKHGWLKTNITPRSEASIANYAEIIARRVGRGISTLNPLLDAHLISKDRANAILTPIATKGNTITIRKFARDPWTVTDFLKNKTVGMEVMSLIWLMMQYEMNIIISGGTGSGKTSFLNICMPFIQPKHRIISIEDTRELQLPEFLYWCPLTTRQQNPEGKGEVNMLDLLVNALRMRPDRIVMGEVRKQREAEVLFEAMHTGHSVYATMHADTLEQTITRLTNPPIDIPHSMLDSVHLNIVMFRDRRKGIRRTFEVGEFVEDIKAGLGGDIRYVPNVVYEWDPREDTIIEKNGPKRLFNELGRHTGLTGAEIGDDLKTKEMILQYLVDNNLRSIDQVGAVMNRFYMDNENLIKLISEGGKPQEVLGVLDDK